MTALLRFVAAALLGLVCAAAQAHKPSDAYLTLEVQGDTVASRLDIALRDLDRDLRLDADDDGRLTWQEVKSRWPGIEALAAAALRIEADGRECTAAAAGPAQLDRHSDGGYAVLTQRWQCAGPVDTLGVDYRLFAQTDPSHRGVTRVQHGTAGEAAVLVPGEPAHRFRIGGEGSGLQRFAGFVREGVHHILIGTDHILFLLSLLLPVVLRGRETTGAAARAEAKAMVVDVLKVVTAFTVAHSITLALAVLDLVNPPSRWIESVIAASVVLAALNNLVPVVKDGRWKLTFAFGLVHGFGFAGALKDLGLGDGAIVPPLAGFNLGVELGQLAIVALFLPVAWSLRGTAFYRRGVLTSGSLAIAAIAAVWLVERAFDVQLWPGVA